MKTQNRKIPAKKPVQSFFDEDINKEIDAMTDNEMISQIKELEDTRYWIAINKYVQDRMMIAQRTLVLLDPVKEIAQLARTQGILNGLMDLYNMAIKAKQPIEKAEAEFNKQNDETPFHPEEGVYDPNLPHY